LDEYDSQIRLILSNLMKVSAANFNRPGATVVGKNWLSCRAKQCANQSQQSRLIGGQGNQSWRIQGDNSGFALGRPDVSFNHFDDPVYSLLVHFATPH